MRPDEAPATEDRFSASTFQRFPVTIVRGRGALVWDADGKEYVDCNAGYGVALVGHCNPAVVEAVKSQADRLITCHGSFYNDARAGLLDRLVRVSPKGLDSALFTNSGAETIEAAIKVARRSTGRSKIIAMKGGYHGKTFGALSATWNPKYREPFAPLLPGFEFVEYGDAESLRAAVGEDTAAVIAEPVQGESGVVLPPPQYFEEVREACESSGALLIMDEIQTGLGRTGKMWGCDHWGVVPDLMAVSKALGGGLPIGALLGRKEVMASLRRGEHTSTFAGSPLACAAATAVLEFIVSERLPEMAAEAGRAMREGLEKVAAGNPAAVEARGLGVMMALETSLDIYRPLLRCLRSGVILAYSGKQTFRLLPPAVIRPPQIRAAVETLGSSIGPDATAPPGRAG
jgi:[amino-group carrier protein]-gamma-(L-lysyl/L-ornithyl)-L-glutamate aminotransferase